jgi:hypothetical protein
MFFLRFNFIKVFYATVNSVKHRRVEPFNNRSTISGSAKAHISACIEPPYFCSTVV